MRNRVAWAFAIVTIAGCVSSPAAPPATPAKLNDAASTCNATILATKVSDHEFNLSVSTHQEGQAKCLDDALRAIVDAKAGELCGRALHHVTGGDGLVTVVNDGGADRQGYIDAHLIYTIQCGNAV